MCPRPGLMRLRPQNTKTYNKMATLRQRLERRMGHHNRVPRLSPLFLLCSCLWFSSCVCVCVCVSPSLSPSLSVRKAPSLHDFTLMLA